MNCRRFLERAPRAVLQQLVRKCHLKYILLICLIFGQTLYFSYAYQSSYLVVAGSLPLAIFFCFVIAGYDSVVMWLGSILSPNISRVHVLFLLFFVYVIGYLLLFSLVVSWPLGYIVEQRSGSYELARFYKNYSVNGIVAFAIVNWLKRVFPFPGGPSPQVEISRIP